MGSTGFAVCLIIGIVLFAVGGGLLSMVMMGVGGVGLLASVVGSGKG